MDSDTIWLAFFEPFFFTKPKRKAALWKNYKK